jgi:hypothetical protein
MPPVTLTVRFFAVLELLDLTDDVLDWVSNDLIPVCSLIPVHQNLDGLRSDLGNCWCLLWDIAQYLNLASMKQHCRYEDWLTCDFALDWKTMNLTRSSDLF